MLLCHLPGFSFAQSESDQQVAVSPKSAWGDFTVTEDDGSSSSTESEGGRSIFGKILLWFPNRIMDALDVVRLDVGAGPAFGAALRLTPHGQMGYRQMSPFSMRAGLFGRKAPVLVETSNEFGIGPGYISSKDRSLCKGEIGAGADLLLGVYGGICADELIDFIAGIFFLDVKGDDIR